MNQTKFLLLYVTVINTVQGNVNQYSISIKKIDSWHGIIRDLMLLNVIDQGWRTCGTRSYYSDTELDNT